MIDNAPSIKSPPTDGMDRHAIVAHVDRIWLELMAAASLRIPTHTNNMDNNNNTTQSQMVGHTSLLYHQLPPHIPHYKCETLDKSKPYPVITNCVNRFKLDRYINLARLSLRYPHMGKGPKFPSTISRNYPNGTNSVFAPGAVVTPGCKTYYRAKLIAHTARLMIESTVQPILVVNSKTRRKRIAFKPLRGLTNFRNFKVLNIVSNGRITTDSISLAKMEADDDRLNWNPTFFPGLEMVITKDEVPFTKSETVFITLFDSANAVSMGAKSTEDSYLAYQHIVSKAVHYPDHHSRPQTTNERFLYRQEQKRLHSIGAQKMAFGQSQQPPTILTSNHRRGLSQEAPTAAVVTGATHQGLGSLASSHQGTIKTSYSITGAPGGQLIEDRHHEVTRAPSALKTHGGGVTNPPKSVSWDLPPTNVNLPGAPRQSDLKGAITMSQRTQPAWDQPENSILRASYKKVKHAATSMYESDDEDESSLELDTGLDDGDTNSFGAFLNRFTGFV